MFAEMIKELELLDKLKQAIPYFILGGVLFLWSPPMYIVILCFAGLTAAIQIISKKFKLLTFIKSTLVTAVIIYIIYYAFKLSVWWGIAGFVIVCILLAAYLLYRQREGVMKAMRVMEKKIFGRPLDKDQWQDGERPKMPKIDWKW